MISLRNMIVFVTIYETSGAKMTNYITVYKMFRMIMGGYDTIHQISFTSFIFGIDIVGWGMVYESMFDMNGVWYSISKTSGPNTFGCCFESYMCVLEYVCVCAIMQHWMLYRPLSNILVEELC